MLNIGVMSNLQADGRNTDVVADFGLTCCQVVSWNMTLCTSEIALKCKSAAQEKGVHISAFWGGVPGPAAWNFIEGPITLGLVPPDYRWARTQALEQWADFAVALGAPALVTHCGFIPESPVYPDYAPTRLAIGRVAKYCKSKGIGFWFETGQETPVTLLRVIQDLEASDGLDNLGINLDPANLILYGRGNPIDSLDVFGRYVRCIHAKDGLYPTNGRELGHEVRVGTGKVNFPDFIKKLRDIGFTGDFIIEREISGEQQRIDIAQTVNDLKGWLS